MSLGRTSIAGSSISGSDTTVGNATAVTLEMDAGPVVDLGMESEPRYVLAMANDLEDIEE